MDVWELFPVLFRKVSVRLDFNAEKEWRGRVRDFRRSSIIWFTLSGMPAGLNVSEESSPASSSPLFGDIIFSPPLPLLFTYLPMLITIPFFYQLSLVVHSLRRCDEDIMRVAYGVKIIWEEGGEGFLFVSL